MFARNRIALRALMMAGIVFAIPLLVKAACSNDPSKLTNGQSSFPEAWVETNIVDRIDRLEFPYADVVEKGQRAYLHSCVRCHGVNPGSIAHQDQQHFIEIVRNGNNAMPALGYKVNAVEAEMIRMYIGSCAGAARIC